MMFYILNFVFIDLSLNLLKCRPLPPLLVISMILLFKVGVNSRGEIQYIRTDLYSDNGYVYNEPIMIFGVDCYFNCYNRDRWTHNGYNSITDTASNSWVRAPGKKYLFFRNFFFNWK